jgi:zinc protease
MIRSFLSASIGLALVTAVVPARGIAQGDSYPPRPVPGPTPALHFPHLVMRRLSNGVPVAVLEDHSLPIVGIWVELDIPDAFDPVGKEGLSGIVDQMIGEGTTNRTADQLADAATELGTRVSAYGFFTIKDNVDPALGLMADQLLHPALAQEALDRVRPRDLDWLKSSRSRSGYYAGRLFANVVYGVDHPYARDETEASLTSITRADVVRYYESYYRPRNATFVVAGDITPDSAVAKVGRAFASWKGGGLPGRHPVPVPMGGGAGRIYLYDRPGSTQSTIVVGGLGPRRDTPDYFAITLLNTVLGGSSESRLNGDLRGKHGWTYGAHSGFGYLTPPELGTFKASSDVATPKTDSSLVAMLEDLKAIRGERPPTDSEVETARRGETLSLPLEFATLGAIAGAESKLIDQHLPLDYYDHLVEQFRGVTTAAVAQAAVKYIDPAKMAIVVVGDRKMIEAPLRAANVAPVVVVNERGVPVPQS